MEDTARLALVEQSIRNSEKFNTILHELLDHITRILENPHDYEVRSIKSNVLKDLLKQDSFNEYMNYVGFKSVNDELTYPKELTLSKLRMAHAAIERKLNFCCGTLNNALVNVKARHGTPKKITNLTPINVLKTSNEFLLQLQTLFNDALAYEDEDSQAYAREQIPIVTLQLKALDRVREQQKKIKTGEIKANDLPFDVALLMELLGWFKHKFFSWVDKPDCDMCGGPTVFESTSKMKMENEFCRVEFYKCTVCKDGKAMFPRYNNVRTLLRTRRGRCGEWANCFTLVARAMGYDTRYVYDVTDHVWCEVFDYDSNTWLHVDPSEAKLNAPLIYSHGWGKKLSYVIAFSRDDLQDVTWRYTTKHKEVIKRRNLCTESELISTIMTLREHRQRQVSEARRRYLSKRCLQELVQLMVERKPEDFESHGRISGSKEWRSQRRELGDSPAHVFRYTVPGTHTARYYPGQDQYRAGTDTVPSWQAGAYHVKGVFRKVETDWRQVYLAREEGEDTGSISWCFSASDGLTCTSLSIKLKTALYENARIDWTVQFDDEQPMLVKLGETPTDFDRKFQKVLIKAELSGGKGEVAWQHAQLFRQTLDSKSSAFEVTAVVI